MFHAKRAVNLFLIMNYFEKKNCNVYLENKIIPTFSCSTNELVDIKNSDQMLGISLVLVLLQNPRILPKAKCSDHVTGIMPIVLPFSHIFNPVKKVAYFLMPSMTCTVLPKFIMLPYVIYIILA